MSGKPDAPTSPTHPNLKQPTNPHLQIQPLTLLQKKSCAARGAGSLIEIGDNTWINNNFVAIAEHTAIKTGKNVLVGTNVEIYDSDFHGIERQLRRISDPAWARSVTICDDVFIGSNVKILKGVTIGQGSVIANGSIVTKSIPMNVIAGGIPAKVFRQIH